MILAFVHDLTIPFTNNPAELEVRGAKVRQRVCGCRRTLDGPADLAVSTRAPSSSPPAPGCHQSRQFPPV